MRRFCALVLALGWVVLARPAAAFPGVLVGKDDAPRTVSVTATVVMQHHGVSVVTVFAEYRGPLTPFAFVLPVPADVSVRAMRTVKRALLGRVEAISAPRLHTFYEQDPCDGGDTEQSWDEHVKAEGPGFLAAPGLPPLDKHYAVSNAINLPVAPTFKDAESEFAYHELPTDPAAFRAALAASGYHSTETALSALAAQLDAGRKLLLVEVLLAHVELGAGDRVRLGGIRFVTHAPLGALHESLGTLGGGSEDVFIYALSRGGRMALDSEENAFLPASIAVEPSAADHLAAAYNGLFDAFTAQHPRAFVTEYAWSTRGCGEPCPDVPLAPDELLTLGGDVLEAETTTPGERAPVPPEEPTAERERFERHLAELMPKERPAAVREHAAERREIERRRALAVRQTYVLTRLHRRYAARVGRVDLTLVAAPPVSGGIGVPRGARGELSRAVATSSENRVQVRFVALAPWERAMSCATPQRFRWGKRWASEARVARAVPLALGLPAEGRDPGVLLGALTAPVPELGLAPLPKAAPAAAAPKPAASAAPAAARTGCQTTSRPQQGDRGSAALLGVIVVLGTGRRRGCER